MNTATLSADGVYRYDLVRTWDTSGDLVLWVMLNPSTADATQDDPTIRKCIGFSRRWGFRGLVVVNLFGLRATNPRELARHPDPVGPENEGTIAEWASDPQVTAIVDAWGAHREAVARGYFTDKMLRRLRPDIAVSRLGTTKSGAPKHPLYVPYGPCPACHKP